MDIILEELAEFLVRAKKATYAGDGKEIPSQRPGFKELEYAEGDWNYLDSYVGFYCAPGQEIVRFQNKPVWHMSYSGGMIPRFSGDESLAKSTFKFLKECLQQVEKNNPYRGPRFFRKGIFSYQNEIKRGVIAPFPSITDFLGTEVIFRDLDIVFKQTYIGGLIIHK